GQPVELAFRAISPYVRVPAGPARLDISRPGADGGPDDAVAVTVDVPAGGYLSVLVTGGDGLAYRVLADEFAAVGAGRVAVRLLHAADGVGPVNLVDAAGTPHGSPVDPGTAGPTVALPAGAIHLGLRRPSATTDLVTLDGVTAEPGQALVVLLAGGSGDAPVHATWAVEASGAAVVPVGPIRTGGLASVGPTRTGGLASVAVLFPPGGPRRRRIDGHGRRLAVRAAGRMVAAAGCVALLLGGCGPVGSGPDSGRGSAAPDTSTGTPSDPAGSRGAATPMTIPSPSHGGTGWGSPGAPPVGIRLPGAATELPVIPLGLVGGDEQQGIRLPGAADGELATVADGTHVGWYSGGPVPGQPGSAVLAGHVTWAGAPAVFAGLVDLRPGEVVTVRLADGTERRFGVDQVGVYPKTALPNELVYRPAPLPELRLVTCDGPVVGDGTHRDNLVVSLSLLG
ncbi:sortase domain-containing protein, partial [Frankia tisae]|uniref:sortase domain-containing protein n=1 Tax=Frankia tisae TaxID=2950104 RepID=UPI0021BFABFD